jgi:hypothetical protein
MCRLTSITVSSQTLRELEHSDKPLADIRRDTFTVYQACISAIIVTYRIGSINAKAQWNVRTYQGPSEKSWKGYQLRERGTYGIQIIRALWIIFFLHESAARHFKFSHYDVITCIRSWFHMNTCWHINVHSRGFFSHIFSLTRWTHF